MRDQKRGVCGVGVEMSSHLKAELLQPLSAPEQRLPESPWEAGAGPAAIPAYLLSLPVLLLQNPTSRPFPSVALPLYSPSKICRECRLRLPESTDLDSVLRCLTLDT